MKTFLKDYLVFVVFILGILATFWSILYNDGIEPLTFYIVGGTFILWWVGDGIQKWLNK